MLSQTVEGVAMPERQSITIPIDFPSREEAIAFAQLVKRIDYETVNRFAGKFAWYNGRSEIDVMWSAVLDIQRQLAEAGFNPR
jgi:hypothetical protein